MKTLTLLNLILVNFCFTQLRSQSSVKVFTDFEVFEKSILQRQSDSIYVINFWATWCKPCVQELPYFDQLQKTYKDNKTKVILVSLDDKRWINEKLLPFMSKKSVESEVVLLAAPDANSWIDKVDTSWSGAIPATVFYKNNNRVFKEEEFEHFSDLEKIVKTLINQ